MEETKQEVPTMSPFCEAIMHNTEDLNTLKGERDCSIIMCSDGDSLAVRMAGNFGRVMNMILKKMIVDPAFARLISAAVNCYIGHLSSYLTPAKDSDYESGIDDKEKTKEIYINTN